MEKTACYCNSQENYEDCCLSYLTGKLKPKNPEQLMRSRYSAFCVKNIDYLIATHHPSKRQANERALLEKTINNTQWLGLKVVKAQNDIKNPGVGYVEFVAFYESNGVAQLHEKSKFVLENDEWHYFDGVLLEPIKFGRNEPCPCGSGAKYKKCHGR